MLLTSLYQHLSEYTTTLKVSKMQLLNQKWWVPQGDERPCPGQCDPAFAMDDDNHWRCGCGTWEILEQPPRHVLPRSKDYLDGTAWEDVFMSVSAYDGQRPWGDIWLDEEQWLTTAEERAEETAALLERLARGAALEEIAKAKSIVCDRNGKLRVPLKMRRCRDATAAACVDKKGRRWEAGCELHRSGCCEFVHPDQPQWEELVQGSGRFEALRSKPVRR